MGFVAHFAYYILAAVVLAALVRSVSGPRKPTTRDGKPLRKPPDTLPLVGNGLKFLQDRWELFGWFDRCQRRFGYETVSLTVPTLPPGVLIQSPQNLDYVFKNEGVFTKGQFVKRRSWDLFGNGIINADGDFWKLQRKAGLAFLNTANLRVLTDVALPRYLSETVDDLTASVDRVVDLQHIFHEITSKVMGKMAYNMEMHADDEFSQAFNFASGVTAERFQNPLWPVTELFTGSRFRKSVATVKDFGRRIVAQAVEDRSARRPQRGQEDSLPNRLDQISGSLIQSLLDAIGDEDMVADAALTYLSAGRDTTAQALTWTFYLLARHPDAAAEIRREVDSLLLRRGSLEFPSSSSSSSSLSSLLTPTALPYTTAVFHEALRLYPPIPFEVRQCQRDTALPDGTLLPRHSVLVWCLWAMHRSPLTWGHDADRFRPERFLRSHHHHHNHNQSCGGGDDDDDDDDDGQHQRGGTPAPVAAVALAPPRSPAEFPVFYGGARSCLGRRMAEAIAVQVVALLVWRFEFVPAFEGERRSRPSLTLPMEGGLPVRVRVREGVGTNDFVAKSI